MFIGSQFDLTFGASDATKSSVFCVCCVVLAIFGRMLWVRVGLLLKEQSDLAVHRLSINANNVSRYMLQTYGQRSFPDAFFLTLWGLEMYAYEQRKWLQVITLHCNTFIK